MTISEVRNTREFSLYHDIAHELYKGNPCYRSTEDDIVRLLTQGPTVFHLHADVRSFIIYDNGAPAGRFSLIHDKNLPAYVQISFFEAKEGLPDLLAGIQNTAKALFPECTRIIAGLNGHLNYGAGFLRDKFDEPPLFGLAYTMRYYHDYFKALEMQPMVSIRYPTAPFLEYFRTRSLSIESGKFRARFMDKKKLKDEIRIYTYLNNACFSDHPYWSDRTEEEDFELFYPFRFLIENENLIIVEADGMPIAFLLWYPDFNQLVRGDEGFNIFHVLRHKMFSPVDTFRFTEFGVVPAYRRTIAMQLLIQKLATVIEGSKFEWFEGGFIFEKNASSVSVALKYGQRVMGFEGDAYRRFAVYEGQL